MLAGSAIQLPEMIPISAGRFQMGLDLTRIERLVQETDWAAKWLQKGRFQREQPTHLLQLEPFHLGRFPVTVREYRRFWLGGGYETQAYWTVDGWDWRTEERITEPAGWTRTDRDDHPVVGASWYEAHAYCCWLADRLGQPLCLPSEAEWEMAARGVNGSLYPWGDRFEAARCNTRAGKLENTTPVGQFSPAGDSPFGCADMVGNVSEWTSSQYRPYPYDPADGRESPAGTALRATRGASWFSPDHRARSTARGMNDPWFRDNDLGFRLAMTGSQSFCGTGCVR